MKFSRKTFEIVFKIFRVVAIACLSGNLLSCGLLSPQNVSLESLTDSNAQCLSQAQNRQERMLASYSVNDACASASNYACESTTYNPGATAMTKGAEQQCANVAGLGQVCTTVDTTVVPTSAGAATTVFHCSNTQLALSSGYIFQFRANTLEAALGGTVSKCQSRTQ